MTFTEMLCRIILKYAPTGHFCVISIIRIGRHLTIMGMKEMPAITTFADGGKIWSHTFDTFTATVYVPKTKKTVGVVNYGFMAPYLLVFEETARTAEECRKWAEDCGLAEVAARYDTSVVFIDPTCEGGWDNAPAELYPEIIANTKIHQYFRDGVVTMKNRFTGEWGDCFIRGAIFRAYIYAFGKSADFVAKNYLKTVNGEFLWGPGEITPAVCILNGMSVIPEPERSDIPVVSIGNSDDINNGLMDVCSELLIKDVAEYREDFDSFVVRHRRWCGNLEEEPMLSELGMVEEPGSITVATSADNRGDDRDTTEHEIGYVAYYNQGVFDNGPAPVVFAFHGGGDSAMYISNVSGWNCIAQKYNFLLIAIENHLNSTATEIVEMLGKLKKRYNIDESRVYASGFSMGGCKSWDCFQEYPGVFAALAPMDATFDVGQNSSGQPSPCEINRTVPVPVFYTGGEITPLPELPFQALKCTERIRYVFEVNKVVKKYDVSFDEQDKWTNKIWGIDGDRIRVIHDDSRNSDLTLHYFDSEDGVCRTVLGSISGQGHECRQHTCEQAWLFMSQFTR